MVEIQNSKITDKLGEKIKESNLNALPRTLANSIQPVIDIGENIDQYFADESQNSASGSVTVFATPSDKDFYLNSCTLQNIKDATSDNVSVDLRATINGGIVFLLRIAGITTTAQVRDLTVSFPTPIKIDRGTNISIQQAFTVGVSVSSSSISGFSVDTLEK